MPRRIILPYAISLIGGAMLVLAFAPFNLPYLIFPSLIAMLWASTRCETVKTAAWIGLCFGFGLFSFGVSWVYISIHEHGHTPMLFALAMTFLFVLLMSAYLSLQMAIGKRCHFAATPLRLCLFFPALWVAFEWLRSTLFTGFPWLILGTSQTDSFFSPWLPVIGAYGVSWLLVFLAALLTLMIMRPKKSFAPLAMVCLVLGLTHELATFEWTSPASGSIQTSVIQGNIPQAMKWQPEAFEKIVGRYFNLTTQHWDSDLIIWPEAAVPAPINEMPILSTQLDTEAKTHDVTLFFGAPTRVNPDSVKADARYHNTLVSVGNVKGVYHKHHLVPFGEYLPLPTLLGWVIKVMQIPMSNFDAGASHQPLLQVHNIPLAILICYEIAYPEEVARKLPEAGAIITITDDSWFGDSIAAHQHLQIAKARALEAGRPLIFVANSGISAFTNARGKLIRHLPQNTQGTMTETISPRDGSTPWVSLGNHWIFAIIGLLGLLGLAYRVKPARKAQHNRN